MLHARGGLSALPALPGLILTRLGVAHRRVVSPTTRATDEEVEAQVSQLVRAGSLTQVPHPTYPRCSALVAFSTLRTVEVEYFFSLRMNLYIRWLVPVPRLLPPCSVCDSIHTLQYCATLSHVCLLPLCDVMCRLRNYMRWFHF